MKWFAFALLLACGIPANCGAQVTEDEFAELHEALNPVDETWKTIPWRLSLIDAQNEAATQGKPLFIWAMDGHPLGCT